MEQRVTAQVGVGARLSQQIQHGTRGIVRFTRTQPLGTLALAICVATILAGVFAPLIDRYDPNIGDQAAPLEPPGARHWLGTDNLGRDMYSRIVNGARISLYVAFFSIGLGTTLGYLFGIISGYLGGKTDIIVQRIIDGLLAFPAILLALTMVAMTGPGISKVVFAISVTQFPRAARVARGVVLSAKEDVYVDAARVIGASTQRIVFRHLVPNAMAPFLILASVALGGAILVEASLSFLGLGVPPPHPSWGRMLTGAAATHGLIAPWLVIAPGVAIMLVVLGFNLFGDTLRDIWDPKLRGR